MKSRFDSFSETSDFDFGKAVFPQGIQNFPERISFGIVEEDEISDGSEHRTPNERQGGGTDNSVIEKALTCEGQNGK